MGTYISTSQVKNRFSIDDFPADATIVEFITEAEGLILAYNSSPPSGAAYSVAMNLVGRMIFNAMAMKNIKNVNTGIDPYKPVVLTDGNKEMLQIGAVVHNFEFNGPNIGD